MHPNTRIEITKFIYIQKGINTRILFYSTRNINRNKIFIQILIRGYRIQILDPNHVNLVLFFFVFLKLFDLNLLKNLDKTSIETNYYSNIIFLYASRHENWDNQIHLYSKGNKPKNWNKQILFNSRRNINRNKIFILIPGRAKHVHPL